jgi:hypothetical protein
MAREGSARLTLVLALVAAGLALSAAVIRYLDDGSIAWSLIGAGLFLVALGLGARSRITGPS